MAAITYKCPNCDGGLVFDPASQKYHCEYCLSDFTQEELERLSPEMNRRELEYQEPDCREPNRREPGSAEAQPVLYTCPSCGAQIVTFERMMTIIIHLRQMMISIRTLFIGVTLDTDASTLVAVMMVL